MNRKTLFLGFSSRKVFLSAFLAALFLAAPVASHASSTARAEKPDYYEKIYDQTILNKTSQQYVQEINSGWQPSLRKLRNALNPSKSYMVIHVIEPSLKYDLRSANHFRKGLLSLGLAKLANSNLGLGHVFTSWRCEVNGRMVEGTTGITGELDKQFTKLLGGGYGLTSFYSHFTDGHLQTPRLLDFEFDFAETMHTLAIEVDPAICQNAMGFVRDFVSHPNQPYTNFGPNLDPTKFEGGGCGSFGVSVLEKSGIFGELPFWPALWRKIRGNPLLFGYGLRKVPEDTVIFDVADRKKSKRVINTLGLFAFNWNDIENQGPVLNQQDPELLLLFLKFVYRMNLDDLRNDDRATLAAFGKRQEFQYRKLKIDGAKQDIDRNFDGKTADIFRLTNAWVNKLKASGYRARFGSIGRDNKPFTAVILDR